MRLGTVARLDFDDVSGDTGELINLARFEKTLSRAFMTPGCRVVALLIDSPGGSPAQSSLLYHRLRVCAPHA